MIAFELYMLDAIQKIRFPALDFIMKYITQLGNFGALFVVLTVLMLCFKKTRLVSLVCATALVLDLIAVDLALKPLVARGRPFTFRSDLLLLITQPKDFSFPSGHTASSFAFATALRPLGKKYQFWAYVLASVIAFSRLYLYVHYPSDVLAGVLIGVLCGLLARLIWKRKLRRFKKH